jgi:hypothetical protein
MTEKGKMVVRETGQEEVALEGWFKRENGCKVNRAVSS